MLNANFRSITAISWHVLKTKTKLGISMKNSIKMKKLKEIIILFSRYFIEIPIWKSGIIHWNHNIWREKKKKNHYSFSRFLLKFQCESLRIIQWNHNIQRKKFKEIILLSRYFIEIPIWKLGIIHWNHNIWRKKQKRNHSFWRFLLKFQCESLELFNEITISREKN